MIISIHIPKTAGTTLASIIDYAVNRRILYDYRNLVPNEPEEIEKLKPFLERFEVIHGHFFYSKYGEHFPDARYITVLRDPVDRTISNYFHLMRSADTKHRNYQMIVENNLDIVGFSALENVRRAQSKFVEGADPERFALIGITEQMAPTVKLLRRVLEIPAYHPTLLGKMGFVPKTNVDHKRLIGQFKHGFVTPSIRRKIRENVQEDWDLYRKAKERFDKLKRELL